jgi:hypothetical protein
MVGVGSIVNSFGSRVGLKVDEEVLRVSKSEEMRLEAVSDSASDALNLRPPARSRPSFFPQRRAGLRDQTDGTFLY